MINLRARLKWFFLAGVTIGLVLVGTIYLFGFVKNLSKKWHIEEEGKWIGLYLPESARSAELSEILMAILTNENIAIGSNNWHVARTNQFSSGMGEPVFFNTNEISGRQLVVMASRNAYWLKQRQSATNNGATGSR